MDILHLIDRLEELVDRSPRIPMIGRVALDPAELLDLVDRMRIAVPESVRQAEKLLEAGREARPGSASAPRSGRGDSRPDERGGHGGLAGNDQVEAQHRAMAIVQEAEEQAETIRREADQYSMEVLSRLESQLGTLLNQVRRGIETLDRERDASPRP